ncbi:sulfotransferase domain-containing protein [Vreelandella sp.]|uniref:sulfotransferase domain-containing protein n=1 Tax=Vreelandella sp. TaxID=3137778 RepID=UPI003BA9C25F
MKSKHLIIPGLAKAGTTFLYDQLKSNEAVFNLPVYKETDYFASRKTFEDWGKFWKSAEADKWCLDISPSYMNRDAEKVHNLSKCLSDREVKVVVCLRNPFEQIYSYYLHDLKALWSRLDLPLRERNYHLFSKQAKVKFIRRFEMVKHLHDVFGSENVIGLNQKSTYSNLARDTISNLISEDLNEFDVESRSNPGGWLPFFIYDKNKDVEYCDGQDVFLVPKGTLLCVNGDRSRLYRDFPVRKAENIIIDSQTWTRQAVYDKAIYQDVIEDYNQICDLLNVEPEMPKKNVIVAKNAELSLSVKEQLVKVSS